MDSQDGEPDVYCLKSLLDSAEVLAEADVNHLSCWSSPPGKRHMSRYHNGSRICCGVPNYLILVGIRPRFDFAEQ